jgi:hypothetical protein
MRWREYSSKDYPHFESRFFPSPQPTTSPQNRPLFGIKQAILYSNRSEVEVFIYKQLKLLEDKHLPQNSMKMALNEDRHQVRCELFIMAHYSCSVYRASDL